MRILQLGGAGVFGVFFMIACTTMSQASRSPASDESSIHIVATTDVHGYLLQQKNPDGSSFGGIDVMSGLFQIARQADPETLLLDSGDLYQGTILSNTSDGATVITWMNYAGYAAASIGNHDFDFGPGGGDAQVRKPGEDPLGVLKKRIAQAKFKFLGANICSLDDDPGQCADAKTFQVAPFTQPYVLTTVHGIKIGILGITTPETPETTFPTNVARLRFQPMLETIERFVAELKTQGAQSVILVMHEGLMCPDDKCDPQEALFKTIDGLAPETRKMIPIILAGHTHNQINMDYNGIRIMINGSYAHTFGYITLTPQAGGGLELANALSVPISASKPFLGQTAKLDPQPLQLIAGDIAGANAKSSEVVGKLASPLTLEKDKGESTLGDFVTDALRLCAVPDCTKSADIAFQNANGLRIERLNAGQVTYGDIFEMLPFDNAIAEIAMKGSQIHDLVDTWYSYNHGNMSETSGLHITFSPGNTHKRTITNFAGQSEEVDDPISAITMSDGSPFDEDTVYRVVMADFLAVGGSGSGFVMKNFMPAPVIHQERNLRDAVMDYLHAHSSEALDYSKLGGHRLVSE